MGGLGATGFEACACMGGLVVSLLRRENPSLGLRATGFEACACMGGLVVSLVRRENPSLGLRATGFEALADATELGLVVDGVFTRHPPPPSCGGPK
jgi:hypothetical protein